MSSVNLGASVRHMRMRHESSRRTHRGEMDGHRIPVSGVTAARGCARPPSSRYPSSAQRSALGNTHRCAVGRSARTVSAVPDLPQAFPGVGTSGPATRGLGGTGVDAKKGALVLAEPSVARGPRSWRWRTAMVFLLPFPQKVLRRMRSPLSRLPLSNLFLESDRLG